MNLVFGVQIGPLFAGLGVGGLAIAFAACAVISSFGSGNSIQAFTVADQMRADLGIPTWITGLVTASLVALVILGGITRIGAVTCRLVPYMAVIYVSGGLLVLLLHYTLIPDTLALIFSSAHTRSMVRMASSAAR